MTQDRGGTPHAHAERVGTDVKETGRVEAFSDGVFAIAITLLVLDLKVPKSGAPGGESLSVALSREWPSFIAYLTSFLTILVMWVNHHLMFLRIRRIDQPFLFLNGLLLLLVTFVPFPTSVVAEHFRGSRDASRTAGLLYTGTYVALAVAFQAMWRYASGGRRLLDRGLPQERIDAITRQYAPGIPLYLVAAGLVFLDVRAGLGLCLALAVFFAFTDVPLRRRARPPG